MIGVETARRARESFAFDAVETGREALIGQDFLPDLRFAGDLVAYLAERLGRRHPQAPTEEDFVRRKMHVEARRMRVPAERVAKMTGRVFLVGPLVLGESHVAVDAEHRAAVGPRIGDELLRDLRELWCHRRDEGAHRRLHRIAETLLV